MQRIYDEAHTKADSVQALHLGHHLLDAHIGGERAGVNFLAQAEVAALYLSLTEWCERGGCERRTLVTFWNFLSALRKPVKFKICEMVSVSITFTDEHIRGSSAATPEPCMIYQAKD